MFLVKISNLQTKSSTMTPSSRYSKGVSRSSRESRTSVAELPSKQEHLCDTEKFGRRRLYKGIYTYIDMYIYIYICVSICICGYIYIYTLEVKYSSLPIKRLVPNFG